MIELRVLTPGDWATWRRLRLAALAEAPYAFGSKLSDWQGEGDREERWRAPWKFPGSFNVIAVLDGQPAGMASGVPADDGVAELISMWVSPAVRGRGAGDQLVKAVERWACQEHARELRLAVAQGNKNATALYLRNGFARTGELADLMPDGVPNDDRNGCPKADRVAVMMKGSLRAQATPC